MAMVSYVIPLSSNERSLQWSCLLSRCLTWLLYPALTVIMVRDDGKYAHLRWYAPHRSGI